MQTSEPQPAADRKGAEPRENDAQALHLPGPFPAYSAPGRNAARLSQASGRAGQLRVLLIDEDAERAEAVRAGLEAAGFVVAAIVAAPGDLTRQVREAGAEVIVCDIDDPSRDALESMRALYRDEPRPVVLFAGKGEPEQIEAALEAGVAAYVVEGLQPARVRPVLDVAIRRFHAHQKLRAELDAARATIEERVVLDRAKLRLMREMGLTEDAAHRRLRRMAMDRGMKLAAMATEILRLN